MHKERRLTCQAQPPVSMDVLWAQLDLVLQLWAPPRFAKPLMLAQPAIHGSNLSSTITKPSLHFDVEFPRVHKKIELLSHIKKKQNQIKSARLNAQDDCHIANRERPDASPDFVFHLVAINMQYLNWLGWYHHNTELQASNTEISTTFRKLFSWWVFRMPSQPGQIQHYFLEPEFPSNS